MSPLRGDPAPRRHDVNDDLHGLIQREEEKRLHCWDARERWRVLQQTITWVEAQQRVPRNSRQSCLARQTRLLEERGTGTFCSEDSAK
jgi:hypothetical protein